MRPTGNGAVKLTLTGVEAASNSLDGVFVSGQFSFPPGTVDAVVVDSKAVGNGTTGFNSFSTSGHAPTSVMLTNSVSIGHGLAGISASSSVAILRIGHSTVSGNEQTWTTSGNAVIEAFGDNYVTGNRTAAPRFRRAPRGDNHSTHQTEKSLLRANVVRFAPESGQMADRLGRSASCHEQL